MNIKHPRFFLMPEPAGGGAAVADPPAKGTPAAPLEGTVKPDADPNASILDFAPPDPDAVMDAVRGATEKMPVSGTKKREPAKKKEDAVTSPTPGEAKKPGEKKPDEPPANLLRKELETQKESNAALTKKIEELTKLTGDDHPRVKELTAQLEADKKETEAMKARLSEYERKAIERNAEEHPEVQAILGDFQKEADRFYRRYPTADHSTMMNLAVELARLPYGKPEYADARTQFENKVNVTLGAAEGERHRNLDATLDYLEKTQDFFERRNAKVAEIREKNDEYTFAEGDSKYKTFRKQVDERLAEAKKIPEDGDEFHPRYSVNKFIEALGDKAGDIDKGLEDYARLVMVGMPPRSKKELAAMSPQQIQEMQARELKIVNEARAVAPEIILLGGRALRAFPLLLKEVARLRAKVGEDIEGSPPDPTKKRDSTPAPDADDDIRTFKPPSIDDVDFA